MAMVGLPQRTRGGDAQPDGAAESRREPIVSSTRCAVVRSILTTTIILLLLVGGASTASAANSGVVAWGLNTSGQLGDGTHTGPEVCYPEQEAEAACSTKPVPVTGLTGSVTDVSAGALHSLALLSNGTVMAWGNNVAGALGNSSENSSDVPVTVSGLTEGAAISAGEQTSLALLKDGTVRAWGEGQLGQLGNGLNHISLVPATVKGLKGVVAISAGRDHELALLKNGTVKAWGRNEHGELGNGKFQNSNVPVTVKGLSGVIAVSAGASFSLALLNDGTVKAWGHDAVGELGDGDKFGNDKSEPVSVCAPEESCPGLKEVTNISAGWQTGSAILKNGTVVIWGAGDACGEEVSQTHDWPVAVCELSGVRVISASNQAALALVEGDTVEGWGANVDSRLGNDTLPKHVPPATVNSLGGVGAIDAGLWHSLAISPVAPPTVTKIGPSSGAVTGGTVVTITGTEFTGVKSVKFGETNALSFARDSATQIRAVSPARPVGKVKVSVTTAGGTASANMLFSFLPTITSVSPNAGPAAGGTSVTITGAGFVSGATTVKFGTTSAPSIECTSSTTCKVVAPAHAAGPVEVTATVNNLTSAKTVADRFTYN